SSPRGRPRVGKPLCIGPEIGQGVVRHLRQLGEQVHSVSPGEWSPAPENTTPVDARETQFEVLGKTRVCVNIYRECIGHEPAGRTQMSETSQPDAKKPRLCGIHPIALEGGDIEP